MRTINLAGAPVAWSIGAIIAIIVIVIVIVAALGGIPTSPSLFLGLIAALAVARLC